MVDDDTQGSENRAEADTADAAAPTQAASEFKVLGQIADATAVGVLGQNDAMSGTPVAVEGVVSNVDGYGLATPDDAKIGGALVSMGAHEVRVDGNRALEMGPETDDAGRFVAGHSANVAASPGGVVGGGGRENQPNEATSKYATVAGGRQNTASGQQSTVGGGRANEATATFTTVAGGYLNEANGLYSTVGGGNNNDVDGKYGTASGGDNNEVKGAYATISGGGQSDPNDFLTKNIVYDDYGTVGGGGNNEAGSDDGDTTTATYATVGGGRGNTASAEYTAVGGGRNNTAEKSNATVSGGRNNTAGQTNATVGGGIGNEATEADTTVGGGRSNTATETAATVSGGNSNTAGGEQSFVGSGKENRAKSPNAAIGGGFDNVALGWQTAIAGGYGNRTFDDQCTVAGGASNQAGSDDSGGDDATDPANQTTDNDTHATVGGGQENVASGSYATVPGGRQGEARNDGSFVWADSTDATFASDQSGPGGSPTGADTFHVRATGGVRFVTSLDPNDDPNGGQYLSGGGGSWQSVSARAAKQHVDPVDPESVLDDVASLEVSTWEYEANAGVRRMGPMAGEFYEAFGLGDDPETIGHVDADGVALAAIQGLADRGDDRDERIAELEATLANKDERIETLEERLAALEDRLETADARGGDSATNAPAGD